MPKLFSTSNKKFLKQVNKPESELSKFICENWTSLFPNFDLTSINQLLVEDRIREGQKKKGSLASERYEIRLRSSGEMKIMINALKDII